MLYASTAHIYKGKLMRYQRQNVRLVQEYNALFNSQQQNKPAMPAQDNLQHVLEKAMDTRKFEIELYWKRATYFWAFIAAAFAGYFALSSAAKIPVSDKHEALLVLTSIGLVFSLGWFLANKGSKFWQENWEKHVDMLEHQVYGPLYKTVLDDRVFSPFRITQPFQFSVSKINQVLSLFITFIWIFLASRELSTLLGWSEPFTWFNELVVGIITIATACYLVFRTRGGTRDQEFFFRSSKVID